MFMVMLQVCVCVCMCAVNYYALVEDASVSLCLAGRVSGCPYVCVCVCECVCVCDGPEKPSAHGALENLAVPSAASACKVAFV